MASSLGIAAVFGLFKRYDLANLPAASELADKNRDWMEMLEDVTDADLLLAAKKHIQDPDGGVFFPKIAQIRKHVPSIRAIPAEEGPPGQAVWARVVKNISSAGFTRPEGAAEGWLERMAAHLQLDADRLSAAIEAAGGGRAIATANHDAQRAWMGGQFSRAWEARPVAPKRPQLSAAEPIDFLAGVARLKGMGGSNGTK